MIPATSPWQTLFGDSAAYECFMGRWSLAAGTIFLDWLGAERGLRWLDVGCGTGIFTELALDRCAPAAMLAVDPAASQIKHAMTKSVARRARFQVADAQALPFPDHAFDVVVSALVINFIPDRPRAIAEMRRVARPDGAVAGYVWDFAADRAPAGPLRLAMRDLGIAVPPSPGAEDCRLENLQALFAQAGFERIATTSIDVTLTFSDFDVFWKAQTPPYSPNTKAIAALPESDRAKVIENVRERLSDRAGKLSCSARANAVKAHAPT